MSGRSIVNELFIQRAEIFNVSGNGTDNITYQMSQFENGNAFFWGATEYTDGTYILSFRENTVDNFVTSTLIPSNRIIIPEVAKQFGQDPLLLDSSGLQQGNGVMRQVEVRENEKRFTFAVVTATNVTVGATLLVGWIGITEHSPFASNQIVP